MIGPLGPAANLIGRRVLRAADGKTADNTCQRHLEFSRGPTAGKWLFLLIYIFLEKIMKMFKNVIFHIRKYRVVAL